MDSTVAISERLDVLLNTASSNYLKNKIHKSIAFCENFKGKIRSTSTLHDTFSCIADRKMRSKAGLDNKYSELINIRNKDFDFRNHLDKDTLAGMSEDVCKKFQLEENKELKISRMINRERAALPLRGLRNQYGLDIGGRELASYREKSVEKIPLSPRAGYVSDIKNIGTHVFEEVDYKNGPGECSNFSSRNPEGPGPKKTTLIEQNHKVYEKIWARNTELNGRHRTHEKGRKNLNLALKPLVDTLGHSRIMAIKEKEVSDRPFVNSSRLIEAIEDGSFDLEAGLKKVMCDTKKCGKKDSIESISALIRGLGKDGTPYGDRAVSLFL
jgi:hypothetical protein